MHVPLQLNLGTYPFATIEQRIVIYPKSRRNFYILVIRVGAEVSGPRLGFFCNHKFDIGSSILFATNEVQHEGTEMKGKRYLPQ